MFTGRALADWFDERIGTRAVGRALFARKIPRGVGWIYTLGSISLFLFLVQAATGAFLAMSYAPTPDHAFDSVRFIMEQAPMGAMVRGLHVWGASVMVLGVSVHMLRTYLTGAYKYPREATWISGVLLLLVVLGLGFTGYLLPWNEKAYWATQVGTKIAEQAPFVGPAIAQVLRGGDDLGAQTLTRFYAFHVLLLPAVLLLLVGFHLFVVVRQGISAPPIRGEQLPDDPVTARRMVRERYQDAKEAGASFYPFSLAKDAIAILVVFVVLLLLAWRSPPEVGDIADPTETSFNPRPEWYFLFLFQLLKYFPGSLESVAAVVLPSLGILALLALPLLDSRLRRHPLDRPLATAAVVLTAVAIVWLTVAGARSPLVSPYVPRPRLVDDGMRLARELHCAHCHSVRGQGGLVGPDLALSMPAHDDAWMRIHFRNPQAVVPGSLMPPLGLGDAEIDALIAYVDELRGGGPYGDQAPRMTRRYCSECHRIAGRGGDKGPDLSSIGDARSRSFIHRYIEDPKSLIGNSQMPGFLAPDGPLTHAQIEDIARYLAAQRATPSRSQDVSEPSSSGSRSATNGG